MTKKKIIDTFTVTINQDENGVYNCFLEGGDNLPVRVKSEMCIGVAKAIDLLNGIYL